MVEKRELFIKLQPSLDVNKLVFVDESGYRLGSSPRHGWAPRGVIAPGLGVHGRWENLTMIGAIALDGFRGFMTVDAGTSIDVFDAFVEHELVPNLNRGEVVVMDNLSAHKNTRILDRIYEAGADVLFTPPYSPEFNPIEKTWAKLKDIARRANTLTRTTFDKAIANAMDFVSNADLRGWISHCGYRLSST